MIWRCCLSLLRNCLQADTPDFAYAEADDGGLYGGDLDQPLVKGGVGHLQHLGRQGLVAGDYIDQFFHLRLLLDDLLLHPHRGCTENRQDHIPLFYESPDEVNK